MRFKRRTHLLDLLSNVLTLRISVLVGLQLLDRRLGLRNLGVEAVDLRLVLRDMLSVGILLQRLIA